MAYLILCEGETDALTLWYSDFPALGIPGSSNVKVLQPDHVRGFDHIYIVSEPDAAGAKFPGAMTPRLREIGFSGKIDTIFMGSSGYKDPSALYCAEPDSFRETFAALMKDAESSNEPMPSRVEGYYFQDGSLCYDVPKRGDSFQSEEIANFEARIVDDITKDDGVSADRSYIIRAAVDGETTEIEIPARDYTNVQKWTEEKLGPRALIRAGHGKAERFREAVKLLSPKTPRRTVYTHTGWREVNGEWIYLHAGGAIGVDGACKGVSAELPPALAEFRLPNPPEGAEAREALKISAELIDIGHHLVTVPTFAAIWRSAIGPADFAPFLVGTTGSMKTSLAAVAQEHFGAGWSRRHLPANWTWTENALEDLAFRAKDAILVIDDLRPSLHRGDREMQSKAERIFRAQGNRTGRGRLRADGSGRPVREPRGMVVATAEDYVWLPSLESRLMLIEVERAGLVQNKLEMMHKAGAEGFLAAAMASWVKWLAPRLIEVRRRLETRAEDIQHEIQFTHPDIHGHSALIIGELKATLEIWQEFANVKIPIDDVFEAHATEHETHQEQVHNQVERFIQLYMPCLTSGKTHARTVHGAKPSQGETDFGWTLDAQGRYIALGNQTTLWIDEEKLEYYLDLELAYALVMSVSADGNRPNVSLRRLQKEFHEAGYLLRTGYDQGRKSPKILKRIRGINRDVLAINPHKFGLEPPSET